MKIEMMVVLSCFSGFFFDYESSIVVVSMIDFTVYTLDSSIYDLCASKYKIVCM